MAYMRRDVRGTTGQDIEKINSNFMDIFDKVFGNINFSDADTKMKNKILTQWIPIQGEGNLDSSNPLYIRFFVPPNTRTVASTNFNVMTEHYRMDSSITSTEERKQEVVSVVSSVAPSSSETSTTEPKSSYTSSTEPSSTQSSSTEPSKTQSSSTEPQRALSSSSQTVGVSSVSNATVGVSSVGGGGVTSYGGGGATFYVDKWGVFNGTRYHAPTEPWKPGKEQTPIGGGYFYNAGTDDMAIGTNKGYVSGKEVLFVDMYSLQHNHYVDDHTHGIPSHSHSISLKGHSHSVTMQPHDHSITVPSHYHNVTIPSHYHNVTIPSHNHSVTVPSHNHKITIPSHTHEVTGSVTIPAHSHTLNEGIKISATSPSNVKFHINNSVFATLQGNNSANNIDITDKIKIGEWNTIKITSSTVARATLYGTLEIRIK